MLWKNTVWLWLSFFSKKGLFLDWYIEGIEEWIPLAVTRPFSTLAEATNHCWSLGSKQPLRQLKINVWFKSLQFPNREIRKRFTYKNPVIFQYIILQKFGIKSWNLNLLIVSTRNLSIPSNTFIVCLLWGSQLTTTGSTDHQQSTAFAQHLDVGVELFSCIFLRW